MGSNKPRLNMFEDRDLGLWRLTFPDLYAVSGTKHVEFINWFDEGWETVEKILRAHREAKAAGTKPEVLP